MKSLVGKTFKRLTVIHKTDNRDHGSIIWKCKCVCGNFKDVSTEKLKNATTQSCGCLGKETSSTNGKKTQKKLRSRAGSRKCRRCKIVWHRSKEESNKGIMLCRECRDRCTRCNLHLSPLNTSASYKGNINRKMCLNCFKEVSVLNSRKDKSVDNRLVRSFGINLSEYNKLLSYKDVCWICEKPPIKRKLAVDHRHLTGEKKGPVYEKRLRIRGLLCWRCNVSIAKFDDNPKILRSAAVYLEQNIAQKLLNKVDFIEEKSDHIGRDGSIIIRQKPEPFDVMDYDDNLGKQ